ncbi:hypothetical protein ACFLS9_08250 [Bacteroidota bacterium]
MQDLREKEIAFIGRITAGVTHEIKNVLASINELAGLMEDLLLMSKDDSFPHKEKFQKVLPRITEQVKRGNNITGQLNKFSHLTDETTSLVDLNEIAEHIIFLTSRFARNKNITLINHPAGVNISFTINPFHLELCLYNCIKYFLEKIDSGGKINIRPNLNNNSALIEVFYEGDSENKNFLFSDISTSEELLNIKEIITLLNGSVEFGKPDLGIKLVINNMLES